MNGLRITLDASCIFHKDYFAFYNQDWNLNSGINFGITSGKFLVKLLSGIVVEIRILELSNMNF